MKRKTSYTKSQFGAYERAYEYFNRKLFEGKLPKCFLNLSRIAKRVTGAFYPNGWEEGGKKLHEISLNPHYLSTRPLKDNLATLVHEMVHLWQEEYGKPPKAQNGYHNKEWAKKMEEVGLMPSTTGRPDGKKMGRGMSHYIIEGGKFDLAFQRLPAKNEFPLHSRFKYQKRGQSKHRYTILCGSCGRLSVWGKPGLDISCNICGENFVEHTPKENPL